MNVGRKFTDSGWRSLIQGVRFIWGPLNTGLIQRSRLNEKLFTLKDQGRVYQRRNINSFIYLLDLRGTTEDEVIDFPGKNTLWPIFIGIFQLWLWSVDAANNVNERHMEFNIIRY